MPSTIARTYGKKPTTATTKRKTSPNGDEHELKRRRVTPDHPEASTAPGVDNSATEVQRHTPPAPVLSTKSSASSTFGTPTKLTRRMLGRSKTESSIDTQTSTASPAARTFSMPLVSASSSQFPSTAEGHSQDNRPPMSKSLSTLKVKHTYADQSRSFLISLPVGDINPDAIPGVESQEDEYLEHESYSSLRLRWGVDNSEDDPTPVAPSRSKSNSTNGTPSRKGKGKAPPAVYLPPNMMNPLKSITELRSKGQSRRFLDEVGYLFEGMDPSNSAGLKRSSASEITTKLCDEDFARKAKAADFHQKTWDVFLKAGAGRGEDKVLDILLVFLVALIARNLDTLIELARQGIGSNASGAEDKPGSADTLASILFFILKSSADIDPLAMISATELEFKQIGLSKKDKVMLSSIYSTISRSSRLFPENTPITTALLTTYTLRKLPSDLIPSAHTSDLFYSLRNLFNISSSDRPFDGSYPLDASREPHYECIRNHLHLLELIILGQWNPSSERENGDGQVSEDIEAARDVWLLDGLIETAICAEIKLRVKGCADSVSECLEVLLRVLVNLTHGDETWARGVINNPSGPAFIIRLLASSGLSSSPVTDIKLKLEEETYSDSEDDEPPQKRSTSNPTFDRLCLALGLLTNLVQSVPEFKHMLRQTKVSPTCSLKNVSCAKVCVCRGSLNALQVLAKIYNRNSPSIPGTSPPRTKIKSETKLEPSPTPPPANFAIQSSVVMAEADASLIQATLSILFGLLMDDSPLNQSEILEAINTPGSDKAKIGKLVDQAKEFVAFYNAMKDGKAEKEREDGNVGEVVRILERLRDQC